MLRPIFLAAPELGDASVTLIDKIVLELQVVTGGALKGSHIFVPHLQVGDVGVDVDAVAFFSRSLQALQEAKVVVAVLDGSQVDENVAFWLGYAFAASRPVIGFVTDGRSKGPLVEGVLSEVVHDVRSLQGALARALGLGKS